MIMTAVVPPFDPQAGPPRYLYVVVADHLEARIRAGDLVEGARLPGEDDLAAEYGVAVLTVRRALNVLRKRGLAVTLPGKGTYILAPP